MRSARALLAGSIILCHVRTGPAPGDRVVPSQVVVRCRRRGHHRALPRAVCVHLGPRDCMPDAQNRAGTGTRDRIKHHTSCVRPDPAPLQPYAAPPACSQRQSLDRTCAHQLVCLRCNRRAGFALLPSSYVLTGQLGALAITSGVYRWL